MHSRVSAITVPRVAEAILDIAPEASLYIANPQTPGDLQETVDWMIQEGVSVINYSRGWLFSGPGDGTSPFDDDPLRSVDRAVDAGIVWINSAGNEARRAWFGTYSDPDNDGYINFDDSSNDETNGLRLRKGDLLLVQLRWDDIWGGATRDLDLFLVSDSTDAIIARSEDIQSGNAGDMPFEWLPYWVLEDGQYSLAVVHRNGSAPNWIQLVATLGADSIEHSTGQGSINSPGESSNPGMLTVGAAPWYDVTTIEDYSSRGPTPDGRIKPDLVGATCGESALSPLRFRRGFCGTSQAAPHVAGMVALVRQRFPQYGPEEVVEYLKKHAEQRDEEDPNNLWGHGFAVLPEPALDCGQSLDEEGSTKGEWASGCDSEVSGRGHARYYTFALGSNREVTITLESGDADSYLYLRNGSARSGPSLQENDDFGGGTNSRIVDTPGSGIYTIEATTNSAGQTGSFTLAIEVGRTSAGPPSALKGDSARPGDDRDDDMTDGTSGSVSEAEGGNIEHGKEGAIESSTTPVRGFSTVSAGGNHTCGIREDGSVACWGSNIHGQSTLPPGEFTSLSTGTFHTCGVRRDGAIGCWDSRGYLQASLPAGEFASVSAGEGHTCGVKRDGSVVCWGGNKYGQATPPAGEFASVSAGDFHTCGVRRDGFIACWGSDLVGQATPPPGEFASVSAGGWNVINYPDGPDSSHTCGVRVNGSVACWGDDEYGQATPPPGEFASVSAGEGHTCGVRVNGSVACWGDDEYGQATPPGGEFASVSAGDFHTCGVRRDGFIACWGLDKYGQATPPGGEFASISAGEYHTCGVKTDGSIACWGGGRYGPPKPRTRPPAADFASVSAGEGHTCGVKTDGSIACWGSDSVGQSTLPEGRFVSVSAGRGEHACGLRDDGTVACWGWDKYGQSTPPVGEFISVSAGYRHSCGVRRDESVACWGWDKYGQSTPPVGEFISISAGNRHSCGVRRDESVACWGDDEDGQATPPEGRFASVGAGRDHTCGVRDDGTVACWGNNGYAGQATPPKGRFASVSAGEDYTCGVKTDGSVACWGAMAR